VGVRKASPIELILGAFLMAAVVGLAGCNAKSANPNAAPAGTRPSAGFTGSAGGTNSTPGGPGGVANGSASAGNYIDYAAIKRRTEAVEREREAKQKKAAHTKPQQDAKP